MRPSARHGNTATERRSVGNSGKPIFRIFRIENIYIYIVYIIYKRIFLAHVKPVHVCVISSHHFVDLTLWLKLQNVAACVNAAHCVVIASHSTGFSLHYNFHLYIFANTGYLVDSQLYWLSAVGNGLLGSEVTTSLYWIFVRLSSTSSSTWFNHFIHRLPATRPVRLVPFAYAPVRGIDAYILNK